jgi:hypothetical protein
MPSITGDLLRANIEQLRLEVGVGGSFCDWSYHHLGVLATNCWIQTLWQYCSNNELTVHDTCPKLQTARHRDRFLVDLFVTFGYSGNQLIKLNECRMWLKAITVADVTTVDGIFITHHAWEGTRDSHRCHDYLWPRLQPKLGNSHWDLWRKALCECLIAGTTLNARRLRLPLGQWTSMVSNEWNWFYSPSCKSLYSYESLQWTEYLPTPNSRASRQRKYIKGDLCKAPSRLHLASCQHNQTGVYLLSHSPPYSPEPKHLTDPMTTSLYELHENSDSKWSIHNFVYSDNGQELAHSIQQGFAKAVSDGSFKNQRGTSAFSLFGSTEEPLLIGWNGVPGTLTAQSAYRSELAGIAAIITAAKLLVTRFSLSHGAIKIGLDGSEALNQAGGNWPLVPAQADFDMLSDIRRRLALSPIKWTWHWIRGHQDKHKPLRFLDFWARQNVYMDALAKSFMAQVALKKLDFGNCRFANEGWSVYHRQQKLSRFLIGDVYKDIMTAKSLKYWIDKGQITTATSTQIDWTLIDTAMNRVPLSRRQWVSKHASGFCAVGTVLQRRGKQSHDRCPRCGESENAAHVLICQDNRAKHQWQQDVTALNSWLLEHHTSPAIRLAIVHNLRRWKRKLPPKTTSLSTALCSALDSQSAIGWNNLLMGRLSDRWEPLQHTYFLTLGRQSTGRSWAVSLIIQLWQLSWNQWDHRNGIDKNTLHPEKQS